MEPEENPQDNAGLTKLDLNNQIVRMRHNVNRAKVQTLNKLSHRIKILRNKKEPDGAHGKNAAKAERLLQEFLVMKKIPPDEVAAFSLSNTKNVDDILKDVSSSWRLKALARLSTHKSLVPVVEMFRSKYLSWEKEISKVLIALKKRKKLKTDDNQPSKNKQRKPQSDTKSGVKSSKRSGNLHSDNGSIKLCVSESDSLSERSESDNEIFKSDDGMYSVNKITQSDNQLSDTSVPKSAVDESVVLTRGNRFLVSSDNYSDFGQEYRCEKKQLNELQNSNENSKSQSLNILKKSEDSLTSTSINIRKNVDPFFMGSNNEEYETENPVVEMTFKDEEILHRKPHLEDENLDYKWKFDKYNNRDKHQRVVQFRRGTHSGFGRSTKNQFISKNTGSFRGSFNNNKQFNDRVTKNRLFDDKVGESLGRSEKTFGVEPKVKLHPSWEAKKKQNSVMQFSGKKIVFE